MAEMRFRRNPRRKESRASGDHVGAMTPPLQQRRAMRERPLRTRATADRSALGVIPCGVLAGPDLIGIIDPLATPGLEVAQANDLSPRSNGGLDVGRRVGMPNALAADDLGLAQADAPDTRKCYVITYQKSSRREILRPATT
ncbi:hypothetical protein BRAO285_220051 [Bradyrhizobium sp. ORS 285]|nr:hypothetical protein BRAO285_220051 [Bradyrhizobium sp. ORS 285]